MSENYLITGYWGIPHVTSENERGIHAAIFGAGRFVLPVGERFRAEYIGNNTVRIYDGKLLDNGAAAGIPAGNFVDLLISNAGQSMNRNDLIVFQYSVDSSSLVESGSFVVIKGAETSGTPTDPSYTQQDILSGSAVLDQMPLYRVRVSGAAISAPTPIFEVSQNLDALTIKEVKTVTDEKTGANTHTIYFSDGTSVTVRDGVVSAISDKDKADIAALVLKELPYAEGVSV